MAAMGDRDGDEDPTWVKLREGQLEWGKVTPVKDTDNNSPIAVWYSDPDHEEELFDDTAEEKDAEEWVPVLPLIPAELGVRASLDDVTPWTMYKAIEEFEQDRDDKVKELLKPAKRYFLAAAARKSKN